MTLQKHTLTPSQLDVYFFHKLKVGSNLKPETIGLTCLHIGYTTNLFMCSSLIYALCLLFGEYFMTKMLFLNSKKNGKKITKNEAIQNAFSFNLKISPQLDEACAPLEKHFGITLLSYRRFYLRGGKLLCLFHNKSWMRHAFKTHAWNSPSFLERIKYLENKNTLYHLWPQKPPLSDKEFYGSFYSKATNGITVYKKIPDCIEAYAFTGLEKNDSTINDIYLFEKNVLERFILFFKSKIFPLVLPNESEISISHKISIPANTPMSKKIKSFLKDTRMQTFYIRSDAKDVKLTKRQEDCLYFFSQGKRMKEIGAILGLSEKTIEFYLRRIMKKLHHDTKSKIIVSYKENREPII